MTEAHSGAQIDWREHLGTYTARRELRFLQEAVVRGDEEPRLTGLPPYRPARAQRGRRRRVTGVGNAQGPASLGFPVYTLEILFLSLQEPANCVAIQNKLNNQR